MPIHLSRYTCTHTYNVFATCVRCWLSHVKILHWVYSPIGSYSSQYSSCYYYCNTGGDQWWMCGYRYCLYSRSCGTRLEIGFLSIYSAVYVSYRVICFYSPLCQACYNFGYGYGCVDDCDSYFSHYACGAAYEGKWVLF